MAASLPPQVSLVFGNQGLQVDRSAAALVDAVLGDAPRDFALHRFDAEEMLRAGAAEAANQGIDGFQIACESVPFLSERYVVRLDHLEKVKTPGRAAGTLRKAVGELLVTPVAHQGRTVWMVPAEARKAELLAPGAEPSAGSAPPPGARPVGDWVPEIVPHAGGEPELVLAETAPDFLLATPRGLEPVELRGFLRSRLKGHFRFAGEHPAEGGGEGGSAAARLHGLLERYLAHPPPGCWLVLTGAAKREGDFSGALLKAVKAHGRMEKFVTYDDYEPVDWVLRESRQKGVALGRPAAAALIRLAGNDLGNLAQELDKLALVYAGGSPPDEQALAATLHRHGRHSLFWAAETLGARQLAETLQVVAQFLAETPHEHPIMIGIWARHFRQLLALHGFRAQGATESELPARLKTPPFIARKLSAQAARFSPGELAAILAALAKLDHDLKTHSHLTGPLMKNFVEGVCIGRFKNGPAHRQGPPG